MAYTDTILKSRSDFLRLFTAVIDGEDAWFILKIENNLKLARYLHDVTSGQSIDLPDYGQVLHKG